MDGTIHQTWKTLAPPRYFRPTWQDSWKRAFPGWSYKLWDDAEIDAFVRSRFPAFYRSVFTKYLHPIERVGSWKYLILAEQGGIYADLDTACFRQWDVPEGDHFGCGLHNMSRSLRPVCCDSVMVATPEFVPSTLILDMLGDRRGLHPLASSGPVFLEALVHEAMARDDGIDVTVYSPDAFYPIDCFEREGLLQVRAASLKTLRRRFPTSLAISFWAGSWVTESLSTVGPVRLDDRLAIKPTR